MLLIALGGEGLPDINPTILIRHTQLIRVWLLRVARSELFLVGLSLIPQHWRWQISLRADRSEEVKCQFPKGV